MTRVRQSLTFYQKRLNPDQFKEKKQAGTKITEATLTTWPKQTSHLELLSHQSTISHILRDETNLKNSPVSLNQNPMRTISAAVSCLADALQRWICSKGKNGVIISTELVKIKAAHLMDKANNSLSTDTQPQLKFSKEGSRVSR